MRILLTGASGGIGSAIKEILKGHELTVVNRADADFASHYDVQNLDLGVEKFDWVIFAHGFIGERHLRRTFFVNVQSHIYLTRRLLPLLKGGVINISSTSGITGNSKFPIYAASKAALNNYTKSMARAHPELKFYAVCPGPTDTKMWQGLRLKGEPQPPSAVADAVNHLLTCSHKSGDICTVRNGKVEWI